MTRYLCGIAELFYQFQSHDPDRFLFQFLLSSPSEIPLTHLDELR